MVVGIRCTLQLSCSMVNALVPVHIAKSKLAAAAIVSDPSLPFFNNSKLFIDNDSERLAAHGSLKTPLRELLVSHWFCHFFSDIFREYLCVKLRPTLNILRNQNDLFETR